MFERFETLCIASTPSSPLVRIVAGSRRELGVALVAGDDHAPRPAPLCDLGEVRIVGRRSRRVPGLVGPQHQRARRVGFVDGVEVEVPVRVEGHRHGPTTGELRAHVVARIRDRGIQDGVAIGSAQVQEVRQRRDQFLGPDARDDVAGLDRDAEAARDPGRGRVAQLRRCRSTADTRSRRRARRSRPGAPPRARGRTALPIEQSTTPPGSESARRLSASSRS